MSGGDTKLGNDTELGIDTELGGGAEAAARKMRERQEFFFQELQAHIHTLLHTVARLVPESSMPTTDAAEALAVALARLAARVSEAANGPTDEDLMLEMRQESEIVNNAVRIAHVYYGDKGLVSDGSQGVRPLSDALDTAHRLVRQFETQKRAAKQRGDDAQGETP